MAAVSAAAVELLAEHGPREVTVRKVAELAGVNHALIHRHFGTKEALIRTVVAEQSRELGTRAAALSGADAGGWLRLLQDHAAYWRVLARIVLDEPTMLADLELPAAAATLGLVAGGGTPDESTRVGAAVAASTTLGWLVFGPHLAAVLGLTDHAAFDARIGETVRAAVSRRRDARADPAG